MNIEVGPHESLTSYRKIAIASWRHPRDPSTYSWIDLPVGKVEEFLAGVEADVKPTLTHFVAMVMADCIRRQPDFNRFLRGGRLYPRLSTDAFITTLIRDPKGKDLSGFVLRDLPSMSLEDVASQSAVEADKLKKGEDEEMATVRRRTEMLPSGLLKVIFAIQEFFAYRLNWNPSLIGMPKDRFGSFIVSNIGALGLERGLIPLSPYTRCPVIIGIGKARDAAVVREGEVKAEKVVTISMTFDHRYADGAQGALVLRRFQKIFENPGGFPDVFSEHTA